MPGCAAVGCSNRADQGFLMKCFPRDKERRALWASKVKRENWKPTDYSYLCEAHFEPDQWEKTRVDGTRKLKLTAVPTIFSHIIPKPKRKQPTERSCSILAPRKRRKPNVTHELNFSNLGTLATQALIRQACEFSAGTMNGEPDTKRPNMDIPKIGTHDGTFHCDEVFACYLLKQLPEYEKATIVRTRNSDLLKECNIVVDVGGEYDPSRHRYDHHQRTFDGTMKSLSPVSKPWVTRLSSAGLVYLHFGHRILAQLLGAKKDDEIVEKLYDKIYENFVEEIDAIDNGISVCPDKPKYLITTNISARVGHLNPYWNDIIGPNCNTEDRFHKAIALVGEEFKDRVDFYAKAWWPARELVKASILQRFKVDEGGEIMELSAAGYPWKDHMFSLEEEGKFVPTIKFVIFLDGAGSWRVQAVPISSNSFELRIPLLDEWRGLRDEELSEKSGIPGGIFVHASGFIGGNKTREGALKMAQVTLAKQEEVMAL